MSLDDYIAIDKTYPTRGGILFKMYSKNKLAKYGWNFGSLGSSRHPYIYYIVPYTKNSYKGHINLSEFKLLKAMSNMSIH